MSAEHTSDSNRGKSGERSEIMSVKMGSERPSQQSMPGKLYGVGVGPGAPDLLTLRAERVLQTCPVICLPARASGTSYAGSIIAHMIDHACQEILSVQFPMLRDPERARSARGHAANQVLERLYAGHDVAFVTEGDPLLYSTFGYLLETVQRHHPTIPIEIVPGVSSITAAAAAASLPLAAWDERIAIIPAAYALRMDEKVADDIGDTDAINRVPTIEAINCQAGDSTTRSGRSNLRLLLEMFDTVVLLKVNAVFNALLDILQAMDLAQNAVFVRRCSTDLEEVVCDLEHLRDQSLDYLSLVIVRKPHAIRHT
jgi:precorrin-2/cobalt-factor-2 C20-methyltransferase